MNTQRTTLLILVAAIIVSTGCSHTVLVVQTDPPGADIQDRRLGLLGQTPLRRELTSDEMDRLGPELRLELDISKRNYIADHGVPVVLRRGEEFQIKRELFERLKYVDITSDPEGVAVYHVFVDPRSRDYHTIKNAAPDVVAQEIGRAHV